MQNGNAYFSAGINYEKLTDNELINLIHKTGDEKALNCLMNRYKQIVEVKVLKYYIDGAEKDDLIQEGMIGLYKAIKGFDSNKDNLFKTFANLCIERQIITAVKGANRQKHQPLNSYISLNNSNIDKDSGRIENQLIDILNINSIEDPLDTITKNEYYLSIQEKMKKTLSSFEKKVLAKYIQGESYAEIADSLNAPVKSIDNAIQRIRKKTIKNISDFK